MIDLDLRRKTTVVCVSVLLIMLAFYGALNTGTAHQIKPGSTLLRQLRSYMATTTPKIDGIVGLLEWSEAPSQVIQMCFGGETVKCLTVNISLKNDQSYLYMLIQIPQPGPTSLDELSIRFDGNHDGLTTAYFDSDIKDSILNKTLARNTDWYFNGYPNRIQDIDPANDARGTVDFQRGSSYATGNFQGWIVELAIPFSSGDFYDMDVRPGAIIGTMINYTYVTSNPPLQTTCYTWPPVSQFISSCSPSTQPPTAWGDIVTTRVWHTNLPRFTRDLTIGGVLYNATALIRNDGTRFSHTVIHRLTFDGSLISETSLFSPPSYVRTWSPPVAPDRQVVITSDQPFTVELFLTYDDGASRTTTTQIIQATL